MFAYRDGKDVFNLVEVVEEPSEGDAHPDDEVIVDLYSRRDEEGLIWGCTKGRNKTVRLEGFATEVTFELLMSHSGRSVVGIQLSDVECTRVFEWLREEEELLVGPQEYEEYDEVEEVEEVAVEKSPKRKSEEEISGSRKKSTKRSLAL